VLGTILVVILILALVGALPIALEVTRIWLWSIRVYFHLFRVGCACPVGGQRWISLKNM
jgi:hypothetical protein